MIQVSISFDPRTGALDVQAPFKDDECALVNFLDMVKNLIIFTKLPKKEESVVEIAQLYPEPGIRPPDWMRNGGMTP